MLPVLAATNVVPSISTLIIKPGDSVNDDESAGAKSHGIPAFPHSSLVAYAPLSRVF
jgi:hypothetical protein